MSRWLNNASIRAKILSCAVLNLIIVGIMTSIVYQGIVKSQERDQLLLKANDIVSRSDGLLLQLSTMELNYRTYLISGKSELLRPYESSYQNYVGQLEQLRANMADDPNGLDRLRQLDVTVQTWRTYVHEPGIRLRKSLGNSKTAAADTYIVIGHRDNADFDLLREQLANIRAAETQQLDRRQQEAQTSAIQLRVALLLGTFLSSVFSLGTLAFLSSSLSRRVRNVALAATQIAQGATDVRCAVSSAQDEIGLMALSFNTMAQIIQQRTDDLVAENRETALARMSAEEARAQIASQLELIEAQQAVIREMSVPVLPLLTSTLVMPLIGSLDSQRLALMQSQALQALERSRAHQLILDITGVPVVDTQVAYGLTQLVSAAKMLGAQVSIVGIRPEVAQALVGLGVSLAHIRTFSTLQLGIEQAIHAEVATHAL